MIGRFLRSLRIKVILSVRNVIFRFNTLCTVQKLGTNVIFSKFCQVCLSTILFRLRISKIVDKYS